MQIHFWLTKYTNIKAFFKASIFKAKRFRTNLFKPNIVVLLTGLILTMLWSLLYIWPTHLLKNIDYKVYDSLLASSVPAPNSGLVVILDIDDASLAQYGQWPWPRYRVAKLLSMLKEMNVLAVGIDFVFAEPDRTSLQHLGLAMHEELGIPIDFQNVPEHFLDNDKIMAEAIANGPFVLGYSFLFSSPAPLNKTPSSIVQKKFKIHPGNILLRRDQTVSDKQTFLHQPLGIVGNIKPLADAVTASGFFNMRPDNDGIVRKVPLLMEYKQQIYPNLSLATLMTALQARQLLLNVSVDGTESVILEDRVIPVDERGNMLLRYANPEVSTFQTISAADILSEKVDPRLLANRVVLMGTSAKGLKDIHATPFDPSRPGVEMHATIIESIISQNFISRPAWVVIVEYIVLIIVGILSTLFLLWARAIWSLALIIVFPTALWLLSVWFFEQSVYFSPLYPIGILLVNFSVLSVLKYWQEEKKVSLQAQEMNKVQEGVIQMLQASNLKLEENTFNLDQSIEDKSKQLKEAFLLVEDANHQIQDSLDYGARIQKSLLPTKEELNQLIDEVFVIWEARDTVNGDIFFTYTLKSGFIVAVIDCTGHGIPGALLTMVAIASLRKIIAMEKCYDPAGILGKLNVMLKHTLRQNTQHASSNDGLEISICAVDHDNKELLFAGARHSVIYIEDNKLHVVKGDRQQIGYKQSKKSDINFCFNNHIIPIKQKIAVYLYSDGFVDQQGGKKNLPFGNDRFRKLLLQYHQFPFDIQKEKILATFHEYSANSRRVDDVTVMGFSLDAKRPK